MMFFENLCCMNAENRHLRPRSIVLIKFGWVMAVIRYIHERPIINRVMLRLQSAVIDTLRVFAVPLISSLADSHLLNANVANEPRLCIANDKNFPSLYCANVRLQPLLHISHWSPMAQIPSKLPFSVGISTPFSSGTWFLGPTRAFLYTAYRSLHLFLHSSR